MKINDLCILARDQALKSGFYRENDDKICFRGSFYNHTYFVESSGTNLAEKAMLIVCEVSEMIEEMRKDMSLTPKFMEELADIWIRLADFTGYLEVDIEREIDKKMAKNMLRPKKHGKHF